MGWPSKSGQVPVQRMTTAQTRSPHWIILGLLILCINTKQSNADVKELTGKCMQQVVVQIKKNFSSVVGKFKIVFGSV
jgi:hypothetical protein